MKLWKRFFSLALVLVSLFATSTQSAYAAGSCTFNFSASGSDNTYQYPSEQVMVGASEIMVDGVPVNSNTAGQFRMWVSGAGIGTSSTLDLPAGAITNGVLTPVNMSSRVLEVLNNPNYGNNYRIFLSNSAGTVCFGITSVTPSFQCAIAVNPSVTSTGSVNMPITLGGYLPPRSYIAYFRISGKPGDTARVPLSAQGGGVYTNGFQGTLDDGEYTLVVTDSNTPVLDTTDLNTIQPKDISNCVTGFTIKKADLPVVDDPGTTFPSAPPVPGDPAAFALCSQANKADQQACRDCVGEDNAGAEGGSGKKFWTAFGCVETSKEGLVKSMVRIGMGLSGGFVLLSILYGAFLLTTSSGDPKRVQEGQEMISSAIMGLFFVIFSVIILQFIGVSILQIPGFGT